MTITKEVSQNGYISFAGMMRVLNELKITEICGNRISETYLQQLDQCSESQMTEMGKPIPLYFL